MFDMFTMVPLFILGVTIIIVVQGVRNFLLRRHLKERGRHVTAEVTGVSKHSGRRSTTYVHTLEYMADGERITVKHSTNRRMSHEVGDKIEIAYLPENPKRFMLAELLPNSPGNIIHFAARIAGLVFFLVIFASTFQVINRFPKFPMFDSRTPPTQRTQEFINLYGKGAPQEVEEAIKGGADVNERDDDGKTPLMRAAGDNNDPEVSRILIQAGAEVDARDNDGFTPLMEVAQNRNNPEVLNVLIQAGADVNAKAGNGRTPLMIAAVRNYNPDLLSALIQAGADVNARDNDGWTPLMLAAANNGNPEVYRILIQAGADVNAKTNSGDTLLTHTARSKYNPEILNVLLQAGADVNVKGYGGWTPLMRAAGYNTDPEVLNILIQAGADVNARDNDGWTPLMRAISHYQTLIMYPRSGDPEPNPEVFNVLVQAGADVNVKTNGGDTPLTLLLTRANIAPEVLGILIQAGADVNARNGEGRTPLNIAVRYKDPVIVSILLASGAEVSESDVAAAQNNRYLKDTAIIEELKARL